MNLPSECQVSKPQLPQEILQSLKGNTTPQKQQTDGPTQMQNTGFKFGEQKEQSVNTQAQQSTKLLENSQIQQPYDVFQINDVQITIQPQTVNTEIYGNHNLVLVYLNLLKTSIFEQVKQLAEQPSIDKPQQQINTFQQLLQVYEYQFRNNYPEQSLCTHTEFTYVRYLFIRMCCMDSFVLGVFQQIPQDMVIQLKDLVSVKEYYKIYHDDVNKTLKFLFQDKDFDKHTYYKLLIESYIHLLQQTNILKSVKIYIQLRAIQMIFIILQHMQLLKESQLYRYTKGLIWELLKQCNSHYVVKEYQSQLSTIVQKYDLQSYQQQIKIDQSSDTINMMRFDMYIQKPQYSNYLAGSMLKDFIQICLQVDALDDSRYQNDQLYIYLTQKFTEYIQRNGELSAIISTEFTNFLVRAQHSVSAVYSLYALIFKNCSVSSNIYTPNSTIMNNYGLINAMHSHLSNLYAAYPSISTVVTQKIMQKAPILLGFIDKEQLTEPSVTAEIKSLDKNSSLEHFSQFVTYFYGFYFIDASIDFISLIHTVADSFLQFSSELNESQVELMREVFVKFVYGIYEIQRINTIYPNHLRFQDMQNFIKKSLEKMQNFDSQDFRYSKLKAMYKS